MTRFVSPSGWDSEDLAQLKGIYLICAGRKDKSHLWKRLPEEMREAVVKLHKSGWRPENKTMPPVPRHEAIEISEAEREAFDILGAVHISKRKI